MMFWYGGHWAFWQAGLMWIGMIVFWGLLIWGIYALIKAANRRPSEDERRPAEDQRRGDARHILDERLARGDIDADEYHRLRDMISSNGRHYPVSSERPS